MRRTKNRPATHSTNTCRVLVPSAPPPLCPLTPSISVSRGRGAGVRVQGAFRNVCVSRVRRTRAFLLPCRVPTPSPEGRSPRNVLFREKFLLPDTRDKPRQQIFTNGPRGGRSNKCLIVLTILSVLQRVSYRVLHIQKSLLSTPPHVSSFPPSLLEIEQQPYNVS